MGSSDKRKKRFRIRTRHCIACAVVFALIALALIALGIVRSGILDGGSYITGFTVQSVSEDGETLLMQGRDDQSLSVSRASLGNDRYFRVKRAVGEGVYLRAILRGGELNELYADGDCLLNADLQNELHLLPGMSLLYLAAFAALISASFFVGAAVLRKRRRARRRRR